MANQPSSPKDRNQNDSQKEKKQPGRNEPEITRNPDSSYEGSRDPMSDNQKPRSPNDPDADVETDRQSTRESGRNSERKQELEH